MIRPNIYESYDQPPTCKNYVIRPPPNTIICLDPTYAFNMLRQHFYNSYVQTPCIQLMWSNPTDRINTLLSELCECSNLHTFTRTLQLCHQTFCVPLLDTTNSLPFLIKQVLSLQKILQTLAIRVPQLLVQTDEEIFCGVRKVWWVLSVSVL